MDGSAISQTVYFVDDDVLFRKSVERMLSRRTINFRSFSKSQELIDNYNPERSGCFLLDLNLPDIDGLRLLQLLRDKGALLPAIFLTGYGDVPSAVQAMKLGAIDFLQKPVTPDALLEKVTSALQSNLQLRKVNQIKVDTRRKVDALTRRQREVAKMTANGLPAKAIAKQLGISVRTVEVHRSNITKKLEVDSTAQLVRKLLLAADPVR